MKYASILALSLILLISTLVSAFAGRGIRSDQNLILVDGYGNKMGIVYEVINKGRSVKTLVEVENRQGENLNVALEVTPDFIKPDGLYFTTTDCTGVPYGYYISDPFILFDPTYIMTDGSEPSFVKIYVPIDTATQTIQSYSALLEGQCLTDNTGRPNVVPLEVWEEDLLDIFPPPYTLDHK